MSKREEEKAVEATKRVAEQAEKCSTRIYKRVFERN